MGKLAAYLEVDDSAWERGLDAADRDMRDLERDALRTMTAMAADFRQAGQDAGRQLGEAIGATATREIDQASGEMEASGRRAGQDAGEGIADGVEAGARNLADATDGPMRKAGGKLKAGAAAAGLAAGAALTESFTSALDIDVALDEMNARLGASEFDSAKHGEVAGRLFAQAYGDSMADVGDAITAVVQNIGGMRDATEDELEVVSARAMDAARVLREDVGPTTRAVGQMMRTGMARDADEAFDILVYGANNGVNAAEDLLDTFSEYSTQFRDLGLDGKQALGILRQGLEGGARDADIVADALKELNIRGKDMTAAEGITALGMNAKKVSEAFTQGGPRAVQTLDQLLDRLRNVKDRTERVQIAQKLLGTQSEDLAAALFNLDPTYATQGMDDLAGATKRAGDTMADNARTQFTAWYRSLRQNVTDYIGNEAIPRLRQFVASADFQEIVNHVKEIGGKLKALWDSIVADVKEWASEHEAEIAEFTAAAKEYFGDFMALAKAAIDFIQAAWDAGGKDLVGIVIGFLTAVFQIAGGILQTIKGIFDVFTGLLTGDWRRAWEGIRSIVEGQLNIIKGVVLGLVGVILRSMATAFGWIPGIGPQLQSAAREFDKFRDRVNAALSDIRPVRIPVNFTGSASGVAPRIVLGHMQHYARGGSIGPNEIGRVAEYEPEVLSTGGKSYLLMHNQPGYITPVSQLGSGSDRAAGQSEGRWVHVTIDGSGLDSVIWHHLQRRIQIRTGGNVQAALGSGSPSPGWA